MGPSAFIAACTVERAEMRVWCASTCRCGERSKATRGAQLVTVKKCASAIVNFSPTRILVVAQMLIQVRVARSKAASEYFLGFLRYALVEQRSERPLVHFAGEEIEPRLQYCALDGPFRWCQVSRRHSIRNPLHDGGSFG